MYRLSNVFDYYMLLTLEFEADNGIGGFPTRAQEKFLDSVRERIAQMEDGLATSIFNYLVLACAGEARHAANQANGSIEDFDSGYSRSGACKMIVGYDPVDSLKKFMVLFSNYDWSSAYGGERWGHIADFACQYGEGKITKQFFVDHIVDLAHNGGFAFDKGEALNEAGLIADVSHSRLVDFLNVKTFAPSLLRVDLSESVVRRMSLSVARQVSRFYNIFRPGTEIPDIWELAQNPSPELVEITWGDRKLEDVKRNTPRERCCVCGGHACDGCGYSDDDGNMYCSDCWHEDHSQCEKCGDWVDECDSQLVEGETWCCDCVNNYASQCQHCGDVVADHHTTEVDGETWCDHCASHDANQCEACGKYTAAEMVEVSYSGYWGTCTDSLCPECMAEKTAPCAYCGAVGYTQNMIFDQPSGQWVCGEGECAEKYAANPNELYEMMPAQPTEGQLGLPGVDLLDIKKQEALRYLASVSW